MTPEQLDNLGAVCWGPACLRNSPAPLRVKKEGKLAQAP